MDVIFVALRVICYVLLVAIFVRVAFSWIGPNPRNRLFRLSYDISEPFLAPVRNLMPTSMGLDFSPMIVSFIIFMVLGVIDRAE
jgi:YggT family protein